MATLANCSPAKANKLLNRLVDKLGIRFTLEVNMDKMGFEEKHLIMVKFGKKPNESFLIDFFKNDLYSQNVYMAKGGFDLFIFAAADTSDNYIQWETNLASNLSEYLPELYPSSYVQVHLGYMPMNDNFAEFVKGIDSKDKQILKLLNENSRISYRDIGKKLGINEDTIRYRVFRLSKEGVIERFTIAIQDPPGFLVTFLTRYRFNKNTVGELFPAIRKHNQSEIETPPLINATPLVAVLSGSSRLCVFNYGRTLDDALNFGVKWYSHLLRNNNPHITRAIILKPVKGLLPLRNLDPKRYYKYMWNIK